LGDALRLVERMVQQAHLARLAQGRDAFAHVLCRLPAEAGQGGEPAVAGGVLELGERVDVQALVDLADLSDAES